MGHGFSKYQLVLSDDFAQRQFILIILVVHRMTNPQFLNCQSAQ